jgi:hypothetical protein
LVCDIQLCAIDRAEILSTSLIRLVLRNEKAIALEFDQESLLIELLNIYQENSILCTKIEDRGSLFPNLQEPMIQEFLLRLLFTQGFKEFVSDIENWLDTIYDDVRNLNHGEDITEMESTWEQDEC